jgi:predicted MPP superfamily phosphohydrolase
MSSRFDRQKILEKLYIPKKSNRFIKWLHSIFHLGFLIAAILWTILFILIPFDPIIFVLILFILIVLSIWFAYIALIRFYKIKINTFEFKLDNIKKPVEFLFISDLHLGNEFNALHKKSIQRIVSKINKLNPDFIVFGGDIVNKDYNHNLIDELRLIECNKKFGVYGNHDALYLKEREFEDIPVEGIKEIESSGIQILNNSSIEIESNEQKLYFGGIPDIFSANFNLEKTFEKCTGNHPRILISHNPEIIDYIVKEDNIDIVLSGHTHGAQMIFPVFGAIFGIPVRNQKLIRGIFNVSEKTKLLISQGIGVSSTRIRIGTDPEICKIKLSPK